MNKFKGFKVIFFCWLSVGLISGWPCSRLIAQQVEGKYSVNYSSGRLKEKGFYKGGLKHKLWLYYTETGVLMRKEKWKNGVLIWSAFYNSKGKVIKTIDQNGKEFVPPPCNCN